MTRARMRTYPSPGSAGGVRALVGTDPTTRTGRHSVAASRRQSGHGSVTRVRVLSLAPGRRTPEALRMGPFVAPSGGTIDSPYGRESPYNGRRDWWHQGMDYAASEADPAVAANAGIVVFARRLALGGNTVVLDHGQGVAFWMTRREGLTR